METMPCKAYQVTFNVTHLCILCEFYLTFPYRDEQQQHVDSDKQLGKSVEGFCIRVQLQAKGARINLHLQLQSPRFVFGQ